MCRLRAGSPSHRPKATAIDQQSLVLIESELMQTIGSIAKVLVKHESAFAASRQDILDRLSRNILDEAERTGFMKKFSSPELIRKGKVKHLLLLDD